MSVHHTELDYIDFWYERYLMADDELEESEMKTIAEQVYMHFDMLLDDFIYEFYEHLDGYEEVKAIEDISDGIIKGIKKWAAELDAEAIHKQLLDANDKLYPYGQGYDEPPYPDHDPAVKPPEKEVKDETNT